MGPSEALAWSCGAGLFALLSIRAYIWFVHFDWYLMRMPWSRVEEDSSPEASSEE